MEAKSQLLVPEDVIVEILLRLPMESIARFRCVCVRWSSLIKDPLFVNVHFKRVTASNDLTRGFLLHRRLRQPSMYIISLLSFDDTRFRLFADIEIPDFLGPPVSQIYEDLERDGNDLEVIGFCDGLICIGNCLNYYTLINPATRERKTLPHPPNEDTSHLKAIGFGFDSNRKDYKLVRIFDNIIHLYSLRSNSWRKLNVEDCNNLTKLSFKTIWGSVCIKGICHWLGEGYKSFNDEYYDTYYNFHLEYTIVSFDLANNILQFVTMPNPFQFTQRIIMEWNGNIGVVGNYFRHLAERTYPIWRLEEYGEQESWIRFSTPAGPVYKKGCMPLGFWKQDEILFVTKKNSCLISYNFIKQEFKNHYILVRGLGGFGTLVKTLLSIEDHVDN